MLMETVCPVVTGFEVHAGLEEMDGGGSTQEAEGTRQVMQLISICVNVLVY